MMDLGLEAFWIWLGVGLLFLILELATGSLFLIWTALAALIVALLSYLDPGLAVHWQMVIFALIAVTTTFLGRNWLRDRVGARVSDKPLLNQRQAQLTGRTVWALDDFEHGEGRVRFADSQWRARLEDGPAGVSPPVIAKDDALKVVSVDGATLIVRPA